MRKENLPSPDVGDALAQIELADFVALEETYIKNEVKETKQEIDLNEEFDIIEDMEQLDIGGSFNLDDEF